MGYTVLIFEDDITVFRSLLINIDWSRLDVTNHLTANNVPDGRLLFEKNNIDLAICDIEVIGGTGLDLLKWARENKYKAEFVFLTNYAEFLYAQDALKLGGNDYILKTEPMDVIESAIERSISRIKINNNHSPSGNYEYPEQVAAENAHLKDCNPLEISVDAYWEEWKWCFLNFEKIKLLDDIKSFFQKAKTIIPVNSSFLTLFHYDFINNTYKLLNDFDIPPNVMFDDELLSDLYKKATVSVLDMVRWLNHFIDKAIACLDEKKPNDTIIEKAKSYIQENYTNDINRQNIARVLAINSDYLSRLFNKQVGISIPEYVTGMRIERAKQLMSMNMLVSNISTAVGITNFSYFSRIFKKYTGMSPREYKKSLSV
ncbi:MAG: helix-turn-helix domain-containing protein [Oscillospiraceae bacterium]|jgi:two-component system response regulator YesN|nr:helix-turn-helix domain-containing protein [Oscillospiraceae bacterium]